MNADTFNSHSVNCPICHHTSVLPSVGVFGGLFTCPNCHTHLVISNSGHYVRDPFSWQHWAIGRMLRRQSHPLARIGRDVCSTKPFPLVAIVSSLLLLSLAVVATDRLNYRNQMLDPSITELEQDAGDYPFP
ncbi:hypothetical protein B9T07_04760 [Limnospira fusiformis CCALA 023]|uniref:hypothetical protein n=1 Tax=Oscillatoriales TaxID=1150 RepID=UPI00396D4CA2